MASVRAQLVEAIDESAAAEDGQQNVVDLLKGGKFSFLLPRAGRPRRTVVMKAQEKLVRGAAAMGDPVALMPTAAARAAAPPAAQAAAAAAASAEAAPPPLSAADAAADAASEILARAARKDADKLSLDDALRDPALFNGLRKMLHDEKGAPEEEAAVLASKLLLLREAVAKGGDVPATLAEDVRALSAAPGMGLSSSVAAVADGAGGAAALLPRSSLRSRRCATG